MRNEFQVRINETSYNKPQTNHEENSNPSRGIQLLVQSFRECLQKPVRERF